MYDFRNINNRKEHLAYVKWFQALTFEQQDEIKLEMLVYLEEAGRKDLITPAQEQKPLLRVPRRRKARSR